MIPARVWLDRAIDFDGMRLVVAVDPPKGGDTIYLSVVLHGDLKAHAEAFVKELREAGVKGA